MRAFFDGCNELITGKWLANDGDVTFEVFAYAYFVCCALIGTLPCKIPLTKSYWCDEPRLGTLARHISKLLFVTNGNDFRQPFR